MLSLKINKNKFRIDEVAEYYSVTTRTIRIWIKQGVLKSIGKGTELRIMRETIEKRIGESRVKTISKEKSLKETLDSRVAGAIYRSIRGKNRKNDWESIVGFTLEQLEVHLEKLFTPGMSWEIFLKGKIHIDHKIPLSVFNFTSPDHIDFKRCWCLENLQPMWAEENRKKGARLNQHFQPSLLLETVKSSAKTTSFHTL